jgi:hypothetical protein
MQMAQYLFRRRCDPWPLGTAGGEHMAVRRTDDGRGNVAEDDDETSRPGNEATKADAVL